MLLTSSWILDIMITSTVTVYLVYKYLTRHFDYWKKEGIFHFKPIPIFGNFVNTFLMKITLAEDLKLLYDKTNEPYFGIFLIDTPVLVIKSPELIKHIMIKDFAYFKDRIMAIGEHSKIASNWLVFQKYPEWKKTRPKLAQLFSPIKIKTMFHMVSDVSGEMINYLNENLDVDSKEVSRKFAVEIMARCFFGIKGKCFQNENSDFNKISQRSFDLSFRNFFNQGLHFYKPTLVDIFKLDFMRKSDMDYLLDAVRSSFDRRKIQNVNNKGKLKDYIDIILDMEATDEDGRSNFDDSESDYFMVLANTLQFFLAGETTSSVISFSLYELAVNHQIQEKAREGILKTLEKYGNLTYENLQEMEYLDMCISETTRKYVAIQILDRKADMDYKIPDSNYVIKKGTNIYIPFYALHNDEKYFPEPQKYIPERFLNTDINNGGLYYLPFGAGPRNCIGERFGYMAVKISLAMVLMNFQIEICDQTPIPIKLEPKSFTLVSKVGLPLKFKRLNKKTVDNFKK